MADLPVTQVSGAKDVRALTFEQTQDVAVPNADTPLGELLVQGEAGPCIINLANTGANPFTACLIAAQASPSSPPAAGNLFPTYITSAQLNTGTNVADLLIGVSANPTTLAAGANCNIVFKCNGAWRIQVRATSALGTTARLRATIGKGGT